MLFPKNFIQIAKTILKRLFRVYAHIYHQHFRCGNWNKCTNAIQNIFMFSWLNREVVSLGEEAHLNTSFKHFIYFVQASFFMVIET